MRRIGAAAKRAPWPTETLSHPQRSAELSIDILIGVTVIMAITALWPTGTSPYGPNTPEAPGESDITYALVYSATVAVVLGVALYIGMQSFTAGDAWAAHGAFFIIGPNTQQSVAHAIERAVGVIVGIAVGVAVVELTTNDTAWQPSLVGRARAHPLLLDTAFAALVLGFVILDVAGGTRDPSQRDPNLLAYALLIGQTLPFGIRRRYPAVAMYPMVGSLATYWLFEYPSGSDFSGIVAIYSVVLYSSTPWPVVLLWVNRTRWDRRPHGPRRHPDVEQPRRSHQLPRPQSANRWWTGLARRSRAVLQPERRLPWTRVTNPDAPS